MGLPVINTCTTGTGGGASAGAGAVTCCVCWLWVVATEDGEGGFGFNDLLLMVFGCDDDSMRCVILLVVKAVDSMRCERHCGVRGRWERHSTKK